MVEEATRKPVTMASTRFERPVSKADLQLKVESVIPRKTRAQTDWCVGLWRDWSRHCADVAGCQYEVPPVLTTMNSDELCEWLSKFVVEIRRKDGKPYTGDTLCNVLSGIQRYLRLHDCNVDLFQDKEFSFLRRVLDSEMKCLKRRGIGINRKKAETISENEEDILWREGLLGDSTPSVLLDTMVWMCGLYFALRSGAEHRGLRISLSFVRALILGLILSTLNQCLKTTLEA